jgi:hypothetical protein
MSSLQKFHRRTNRVVTGPATWPATAIGGGDATYGFWLAGISTNKLIVAPKSTELVGAWGSGGTARTVLSISDGLANTNILYSYGAAAHPPAYNCKTLTLGGYNTWYLPAKDELISCVSNKSATPFATANNFTGSIYWSSTEQNGTYAWYINTSNGVAGYSNLGGNYKTTPMAYRAVRKSTI